MLPVSLETKKGNWATIIVCTIMEVSTVMLEHIGGALTSLLGSSKQSKGEKLLCFHFSKSLSSGPLYLADLVYHILVHLRCLLP